MKLKILAVVVLGAVGVGAAVVAMGGIPTSAASTTRFLASAAATGDVTNDIAATGTIAAQARYGLAFGAAPYLITSSSTAPGSQATWSVRQLKVKLGDSVKKGDVLAVAATTDLDRQLASARVALRSAIVNQRIATTNLSDANDAGVTARIQQAQIGLYGAQGQVASAQQSVNDLRSQIAAATLKAPIDGIVTELDIVAGFDAPSGDAMVIDAPGFEITTDVVESDLAEVKVGQAAAVTVSAVGADLQGTVSAISPVAGSTSNSGVVSYPVTVMLADAPATVRSGMSADVTITIASATNVLTVPAAALRGTSGDYSVLLIAADGTTSTQTVDVGLVTNTLAEIKSGLTAGQQVVTGTSTAQNATTTSTTGGFGGGVGIPGGVFGGGRGGNGGRGGGGGNGGNGGNGG